MKKIRYLVIVFTLSTMSFFTLEAQNPKSENFTGYETLFHANGELHVAQKLVDGVVVQQEEYYSNGSLKERAHTSGNFKNGPAILYYEDRSVQAKCYFLNGQLNGLCEKYFPSGQLSYTVNYINGQREGLYQYYYPEGNKAADVYYRVGKKHGGYIGFHNDGSIYITGTYFDDKRHGEFVMYPKDDNGILLPKKHTYHYHGKDITKEQYDQYKAQDKYGN